VTARGPSGGGPAAGPRLLRPLRRLGVLVLDYEYAVRHQLRAVLDREVPEALISPGAASGSSGSPVVLLPGIYETWRFLAPLARRLHAAGHPVHVIAALGRNRLSLTEGAAIVARHLEEHDLRDVTIVAHSKGGLVAKTVMGLPEAGKRVRCTIAISTPFSGSSLARFLPVHALRALRPDDPAMVALAAEAAANARIVSIWGWYDPHIPGGSRLRGAERNEQLPVGGHFRILGSPRLLALVDELTAD
jgi:hypothetical protein